LTKYTQQDIKKVFLMGIEHKLQIDYQKTLPTVDTDIGIPIITIPIYNWVKHLYNVVPSQAPRLSST
jgi:hypothetical protein